MKHVASKVTVKNLARKQETKTHVASGQPVARHVDHDFAMPFFPT